MGVLSLAFLFSFRVFFFVILTRSFLSCTTMVSFFIMVYLLSPSRPPCSTIIPCYLFDMADKFLNSDTKLLQKWGVIMTSVSVYTSKNLNKVFTRLTSIFVSLQMANVTPEYVAEIVDKFEVSDENKQRGVMGIEGNTLSFFCWNFIFISTPRYPSRSFFLLHLTHSSSFSLPAAFMAHHQFTNDSVIVFDCSPSSANRSHDQVFIVYAFLEFVREVSTCKSRNRLCSLRLWDAGRCSK